MDKVRKDGIRQLTTTIDRSITNLEASLDAEGEYDESFSNDEVKLHGLSKTLRVLLGQTKRQPRPEKIMLALQILLGLSIVDGNAIAMVQKQVPGTLQLFFANNKNLQPLMIETALRILINLSSSPENHVQIAMACSESIASVLSVNQDVQVILLAVELMIIITASYEVQRQICDQRAILAFFVDTLSRRNHTESVVLKVLHLIFKLGPSSSNDDHTGLSLVEFARMSVLPSKKRMVLCSMTALETIALSLGVDPYNHEKNGLIEALLRCRYPPVPSRIFEYPGMVDKLITVLVSVTADNIKTLICHIIANYSLIPDNRLEILYGDGDPPVKRVLQVISNELQPLTEQVKAYKSGPPKKMAEDQNAKSIDRFPHVRAAFSKKFDTVYEAWAYFDKSGDWIVSSSEFETLACSLSLGISESEILKCVDPKNTKYLDPYEFCAAVAWHELPGQPNSKVAIARLLKEANLRRKQVVASAASRSKVASTSQMRMSLSNVKNVAPSSRKFSSQKLKVSAASAAAMIEKSRSKPSIVLDEFIEEVLQQQDHSDMQCDQPLPETETPLQAWKRECQTKLFRIFQEMKLPVKMRLKLLLTTLINVSQEVVCHDVLVLEHLILDVIEPCLWLDNDGSGIQEIAKQLKRKLQYILDESDLLLSEEQQRRVQQSVGKWQNAGLNAVFNTWKHVLLLLRIHSISIPSIYRDVCYELQVPSCAATASTALRTFLMDSQRDSFAASNVGLTAHSAQALSCALRGVSSTGEKLRALNIVQLRAFEGMAPLKVIDVADNNIRDAGFAQLITAITEIKAEIASLNVSANHLTEQSGDQLALLIGLGFLEDLKVTGNKLGGKGIRCIALAIENNASITSLDISKNVAAAAGGIALGKMLALNSTLRQLNCSWNEICGESNEELFKGVAQNRGLKILNASWNTHSKKSIFSIGAAIRSPNIEELDLSNIGLDTKEAVLVANSIRQVRVLHRLVLNANPIGPGGCRMVLRASNEAYPNEGADSESLLNVEMENCGAVDSYTFNPAEPAGKYMLDLADPVSHSIVHDLIFIASQKKGAFLIGSIKLNEHNFTLPTPEAGDDGRVALPQEGILQFRYVSTQRSATVLDALNRTGFRRFKLALSNTNLGWEELNKIIDIHVGTDTFFTFQMVKDLYDIPHLPEETRIHLVVTAFHHMDIPNGGRDLLYLLSAGERIKAEALLGHHSLEFCHRNPTGFYRLQLSDPLQRSIALHLQRLTQDQSEYLNKRMLYFDKRLKGGVREELPSVWRNMKMNGDPIQWVPDLALPTAGILECDFIWLLKPSVHDLPMTSEVFEELKSTLKGKAEPERIRYLRNVAEESFFTTFQVIDLLELFQGKLQRVEILVLTFSKTTDFHGLTHLYAHWISPSERAQLTHRVGISNLFDEVMAVGYYELNLGVPEERFVVQELLQLACSEPGDNQVDTQYEGCDFQVPSPWIHEVPRKGILQMYYCRESQVIRKIFSQGAYDHTRNPTWAGPHGLSTLCPAWLKPFCEPETNQAVGEDWVQPAKLRLIKAKMRERFGTAEECFRSIDGNGHSLKKDATLSRNEWSAGLFGIGIWLHPNETKALFQVLDDDASGSIDLKEFRGFWNAY